ncbi:MAG: aminodeoxychorismate/anthranilate synthase component II [Hymenobacteraceae bacterium]|nr:aminodeoxychorismate/anthranilate synthase component II [Hymenobacteraceae bacterium]MDX5398041.1 aminodeoxychorismate/anthranilate synthase component II [Hymenobacteraceae bacterium]MDX5514112.1 aminodeoxychorismate/anthranilate synthase component II [Hymenobacteraceae bacterium]
MLLILDNFDSFTYNLLDYFGQLGVESQVVRNNVPLQDLEKMNFSAILLSPGPGTPKAAGCMMAVIEKYHKTVPMLGVCLGHQALGEFFGAELVKAQKPMHGKISEITCRPDLLFKDLPEKFSVTRYHSLVLQTLGEELLPLAYTSENELMAMKHNSLPVYGLQFHPEAILTTHGLQILRNWLAIVNIAAN